MSLKPAGESIPSLPARPARTSRPGRTSEEALPADSFARGEVGPEVQAAFLGGVSYVTPMELTKASGRLPRPVERIDSVREVLTIQDVWDAGITGKGIGVAVIDTGVYPHPDLKGRLVAFKDFVKGETEPYDDNGHGSHCAGLVAGDGAKADGRFKGPAFEADIIGVKVLDGNGGGSMANVVRGIQWCIDNKEKYNIRVINLSLGAGANQKAKDDVVALACDRALAAGIVPIVAAGNSGPTRQTIGTPAISPNVLTVGAYDDKNSATLADDTMAYFSSRGPTTRDQIVKPDIAAPGVQMVSHRSPGSSIDRADVAHLGDYYVLLSGTSMATPVTAGVAAVVLQANPDLTPQEVIQILKETAQPLRDTETIMQGHGLVDPAKAVKRALALAEDRAGS